MGLGCYFLMGYGALSVSGFIAFLFMIHNAEEVSQDKDIFLM